MPRAVSWLEVRGPTLPLQIYSARRALLLNYYTKSELASLWKRCEHWPVLSVQFEPACLKKKLYGGTPLVQWVSEI